MHGCQVVWVRRMVCVGVMVVLRFHYGFYPLPYMVVVTPTPA